MANANTSPLPDDPTKQIYPYEVVPMPAPFDGYQTTVEGKTFYSFKKEHVINAAEECIAEIKSRKPIVQRFRDDIAVQESAKKVTLRPDLQMYVDKFEAANNKGYTVQEFSSDDLL